MIIAILITLAAFAVVGCGAHTRHDPEGELLSLYYAAKPEEVAGGDILAVVQTPWGEQTKHTAQRQAEEALGLLLGECEEANFISPLPEGTRLLKCIVSGSTAVVDFSDEYGGLSGMRMTIADYCVALTLTQIEPIRLVRILVNGQELPKPYGGALLAGNALLSSTEDVVRTFAVRLYFRGADGTLAGEDRILTLYEGESRGTVILNALLAKPESTDLETILPQSFSALSFRMEKGVCFVNLPAADEELLPEDPGSQDMLLRSIVKSFCSLDDVDAVQILVDGEMQGMFGSVDISLPLTDIEG